MVSKLKMIKKSFTRKISTLLAVILMTSIIYPYQTFAQSNAFSDVNPTTGEINGASNPFLENTTTNGSTGFGQIQDPSYVFEDQVDALGAPDSRSSANMQSCLTSIVQDSLINMLGGTLGGALKALGLGELIGGATGAISGSLGGIFDSTLQGFTDSIGGSLGDSLGGLGDSLSSSGSGSFSDFDYEQTFSSSSGGGGGGGATVPVNEDELRAINESIMRIDEQIRGINQEIKGDTGLVASKEGGDGATSLDGIMFCLANKAIEGILSGTIDWVNRGFNGNPAFVDDPEKFFGDIADYEFGVLLDELSGGLLCSHIDASIRINLVKDYNNQKYGSSRDRRRCTLSDQVDNLEAFVNGDFSQGGWDAWVDYTSNPYSNYYSAQVQVREDLNSRISRSQGFTALELDWNDGYQSIRDSETGEITTPGSMVQSQVEKRLNTPIDRLTFADEFDEILNSTINQFVKISIGEVFDGSF